MIRAAIQPHAPAPHGVAHSERQKRHPACSKFRRCKAYGLIAQFPDRHQAIAGNQKCSARMRPHIRAKRRRPEKARGCFAPHSRRLRYAAPCFTCANAQQRRQSSSRNWMKVGGRVTVHPTTANDAKLIQVLLDNPGSTSAALTRALGWKAQSWHMRFGTICSKRALYLWPAPDAPKRNSKFYSGNLADLKEPENLFTMKLKRPGFSGGCFV